VIILLETVHADAHELLEAVDETRLVAMPPDLDADLPAADVRAVVTRGRGQVTPGTFDRFPNLEVVARCGAGLDNIDTGAAAAAGVAVAHAPGSTTHAVAEQALMLMLGLARRVVKLDSAVKADNWAVRDGYMGTEMGGKRLGVIGLGAIGARVAAFGAVLGMDVCYWSRSERETTFERLDLDELLSEADVVQICVALTPETRGLIGAPELALLKPGALMVNTARGPIVDHSSLAGALESGHLGGYAADVWDPEPATWPDPVLTDERVLVTPHVAALTDVTYREICVRTCAAVAGLLSGGEYDSRCIYQASGGS
jgi:D-3-phosphoglycerate dehydrogenase